MHITTCTSPHAHHHMHITTCTSPHAHHHMHITTCTSPHAHHHMHITTYTSPHAHHHIHITTCTSPHAHHHMHITIYTSPHAHHHMHITTCTSPHAHHHMHKPYPFIFHNSLFGHAFVYVCTYIYVYMKLANILKSHCNRLGLAIQHVQEHMYAWRINEKLAKQYLCIYNYTKLINYTP